MTPTPRNRVIALAALAQCCELVRQIAWTGQAEPAAFNTCIDSIFTLEATDIDAIYSADPRHLLTGLRILDKQLAGNPKQPDMEITRYAVAVMYLARKLGKRADIVAKIRSGILAAQEQARFFASHTHPSVIARLAETYQETLSQLGPRIIVQGQQTTLANSENAARIRALLLAGVRAAILWQQAGGNRLRLFFGRQALRKETRALLATF